ncbi:MAG: outer membrane beta-barrel protein [Roseiarcus sp.]
MANLKVLVLASGAVLALVRSAAAADLLPPPPALEPPPPAAAEFSGWYLRGDIGIGVSANAPNIAQTPDPLAAGIASGYFLGTPTDGSYNSSMSTAGIFSLGVGYQVNNWLRFDVTGEYRGGSHFQSLFVINDPSNQGSGNPTQLSDFYRGDFSSLVGLVNGYADLGTWSGVTPYVGAGVGFARNTLSGLTDEAQVFITDRLGNVASWPAGGYASDNSKWNFAWALMAGIGFDVTQNLKLELGYRYLDLGKFGSGQMNCLNGTGAGSGFGCSESPIVSKRDVAFNDFRIGLRWMIGDEQPYAPSPAPLVRKY